MQLTQTAPDSTSRALDDLAIHADTAKRIGDRIEDFLNRFRGHESGENAKNAISEVPVGHFAQLERLNRNIARAEDLARELASIG